MESPRRRAFLQHTAATFTLAGLGVPVQAQQAGGKAPIELEQLRLQREDADLLLTYALRFELPRDVEDVLLRGVTAVFVARAETFRERWYWTDKPIAQAERRWRLSYQPLTRRWKLTLNGLNQPVSSLSEALGAMQRGNRWLVAENLPGGDDAGTYTEFSFGLDRTEFPRPLQIGLSGQSDWNLSVQRRLSVQAAR